MEGRGEGGPLAVLVLAYGGPQSLDEVEPFLTRVLHPHPPTAEMVQRALARYRAIGCGSPLAANTLAQARALEAYLGGPGGGGLADAAGTRPAVATFVGMRFAEPTIASAVERALEFGRGRAVAMILASHQSAQATGGYVADVRAAVASVRDRLPGGVEFVPRWHADPRFLDAVTERVWAVLPPPDRRTDMSLLFTAHSLPVVRGRRDGVYESALLDTARGVMTRLGDLPWRLAYTSRSGRPGVEWLQPDAEQALAEEAAAGRRDVVVVPLGFVSEHLETLYDLDIALAGRAAELGLVFHRAQTVQDASQFIAALGAAVTECALAMRAATA